MWDVDSGMTKKKKQSLTLDTSYNDDNNTHHNYNDNDRWTITVNHFQNYFLSDNDARCIHHVHLVCTQENNEKVVQWNGKMSYVWVATRIFLYYTLSSSPPSHVFTTPGPVDMPDALFSRLRLVAMDTVLHHLQLSENYWQLSIIGSFATEF